MTREEFFEEVRAHLALSSDKHVPSQIDGDAEILASGLVDSLTLVQLLMQLEAKFSVRLNYSKIKPSNLRTLNTLFAFVCEEGMQPKAL